MAVTRKELKKISEKMSVVTSMLSEVQDILGSDDYEMVYRAPACVDLLSAVDLVDLAKIANKKVQLKRSYGMYDGSFSIYGTTFKASFLDDDAKYFLDNGIVVMKGE